MEVNDLFHEPPMVMAQNDNHFVVGEVTIWCPILLSMTCHMQGVRGM
jgi:hypothetical protein